MKFTSLAWGSLALLASVGVHAALAALLVFFITYAPSPDLRVELDLSSVEMSFAEKVEESPPVLPQEMSAPSQPPRPDIKTPEIERQERVNLTKNLPEPIETKLPEPELDHAVLKTPPPEKREVAHQESAAQMPVPQAAPRQARIDAPPSPRRSIRPDYPRGARQRGEEGDVLLRVTISDDGRVSAAEVATSSGFGELDEAALKAVREARFRPAKSGSKSVESTATLKLTFRLK